MAKSSKFRFIVSIVMLVSCLALIGTATWAWYTLSADENIKMDLYANGMIILAFDPTVSPYPGDGDLTPAIEKTDAIANNHLAIGSDYNVLSADPTGADANNPIRVAAGQVVYKPVLNVYISGAAQEVDGVPVMEQNLYFGLGASIVTEEGSSYRLDQTNLSQVFGYTLEAAFMPIDSTSAPAEGDYEELAISQVLEADGTPKQKPVGSARRITGDQKIYFRITIWLDHPQGLLPPEMMTSEVSVLLSIASRDVPKD